MEATATAPVVPLVHDARETLSERLYESLLGGMELLTVHIGLSTGLYATLAQGPLTTEELSRQVGLDQRYVREWAEQQAATELIEVDNPAVAADERRYSLCGPYAEVLLDPTSPYYMAPAGRFVVGLGRATPAVVDAFTTGEGVPYADYGADIREGIAAFNRPMVTAELADIWMPATGDVHRTLLQAEAPRILDVGCGLGWTSVALARAYPQAVIRGIDLDAASVAEARRVAAEAGVADRVTFTLADATTFEPAETFDLVTCFETLHDMGDPVGALRAARRVLAPGGQVLIGDDRGAEQFTVPADPFERLAYAFSVLHCVPATRAEHAVIAHGTVVRPSDALGWIAEAGFARGEVLDIDNEMWRFYLATP
jgi:SAM-dependent methyltransferase